MCRSFREFGIQVDSNGVPSKSACAQNTDLNKYTTPESLRLFEAFYSNENEIQDKYMTYLFRLVGRFSDNSNIFGINGFDNPFPSNFLANSDLLKPKNFDKNKLAPLY